MMVQVTKMTIVGHMMTTTAMTPVRTKRLRFQRRRPLLLEHPHRSTIPEVRDSTLRVDVRNITSSMVVLVRPCGVMPEIFQRAHDVT
jgi:hypothetical protein